MNLAKRSQIKANLESDTIWKTNSECNRKNLLDVKYNAWVVIPVFKTGGRFSLLMRETIQV